MKSISINRILISVFAVLIFAALVFSSTGTAYADGNIVEFTVIYSAGNWELKCGEVSIGNASGSWVDNVDNQFSVLIDSERADRDFTVSFILPDDTTAFKADSSGNPSVLSEIIYTEENDSPLFFSISNTGIIGGIWEGVEYKSVSDTEYTQYTDNQSLIRFGKGIGKGEYEVRAYTEERFEYMGKACAARRYCPETFSVTIVSNPNPPMNVLTEDDKTIIYGQSLNKVAEEKLSDYLGTYAPSENGDYMPVVTTEKQIYKFDYVPRNPNYDSKENIEIEFTVKQKEIEIAIGNAQIICGEESIDLSTYNLNYYVRTPLPAGDTEEDLNLSFYFSDSYGTELTDIDTSVPGEFLIKARTANINYRTVSVNRQQNAFAGGRYFIFPTALEYEIDGIVFTVNRVQGFERTVPEFFKLDDSMREAMSGFNFTYDKDKKVIGNVYVLAFKEQSNYTYAKYDEEFYVTVSQQSDGKYPYISYLKDGAYTEFGFTEDLQIVYENGTGGKYVYFVTLNDNIDYQSGYMWYHTLLIVFTSLSFAGCIVMVIILIKKRWIL